MEFNLAFRLAVKGNFGTWIYNIKSFLKIIFSGLVWKSIVGLGYYAETENSERFTTFQASPYCS